MTEAQIALPEHMTTQSKLGSEISITGKWIPTKKGGLFRKSDESKQMIQEWQDIFNDAKGHEGILSTEVNHAVGQDAVLIHHVFDGPKSLVNYFNSTANDHQNALMKVAKSDAHLVCGMHMTTEVQEALTSKNVAATFANYLFGYVKHDYAEPDPKNAIQVTAKWTCKDEGALEDLIYWWQMVGTDAYEMEKGLVRFEVYQVIGENALIIHETFETSDELKFHLTKGTAAKYKKEIDAVAYPENYFFRGPVSRMIRTYSKFMHLPATYSTRGSHYTKNGGNMSNGLTNNTGEIQTKSNTKVMENQGVTVVYSWAAKEGKSESLKAIYDEVTNQMKENEPGALAVECYFDESASKLVVIDNFADANAVGFHLGTTAAGHFQGLLEVANPGPFLFCGDVPEEMKQAAINMGLDATFAPKLFGFERAMA